MSTLARLPGTTFSRTASHISSGFGLKAIKGPFIFAWLLEMKTTLLSLDGVCVWI